MTVRDIIDNIGKSNQERKERLKEMEDYDHFQHLIAEKKKSANEREMEKILKEKREAEIKIRLDELRKEREHEIHFEHNILDAQSIMKSKWEIMKEPNLFDGRREGNRSILNQKNIFTNQKNVLKSNSNVLKDNKKLLNNNNSYLIKIKIQKRKNQDNPLSYK